MSRLLPALKALTLPVIGAPMFIVYTGSFTGVHNYLKSSIAAAGLGPDNLPACDPAKMNFGEDTSDKAWKDIWGCGQGIGAIQQVRRVTSYIAQLQQQYANAPQRLGLGTPV
ncbi:hypothetical protein [Pseudomonas aeruginosa]|uniref:hypothetical protein n=1 Tax=Pseudomonas aeruginosa TaxID=287 RepID=UPI003A4E5E9B